jgi:thiol-disulfide isomerase/thioredoxin
MTTHNNILVIDKKDVSKNGDEIIMHQLKKNSLALVMVQASWCGYCKQAKPHFKKAADMFEGKVQFATIPEDGPNERKELINMLDVRGYPTYYVCRNGVCEKSDENLRTVEGITSFLNKNGF